MLVVPPKLFAVLLRASVHGRRVDVPVLANAAGAGLGFAVRQAIGRDRRRIEETDRTAVRLALLLRELEQVERAFDVDMMRRNRCELGSRGEERGEVEHAVDLELGEDPLEQAGV